jgi:hypothetical protein
MWGRWIPCEKYPVSNLIPSYAPVNKGLLKLAMSNRGTSFIQLKIEIPYFFPAQRGNSLNSYERFENHHHEASRPQPA